MKDTLSPKYGPYLPPSARLTQEGPEGIRYDYNDGVRVSVPARSGRRWRVTLRDLDTSTIVYCAEIEQGLVTSTKKYFVRFSLQVIDIADGEPERVVLEHDYDASDRQILIQVPVGTLGDVLAWFPYAAKFSRRHGARVVCMVSGVFIPLFANAYPEIIFKTREEVEAEAITGSVYATYRLGLFFQDESCEHQPTDFRFVGLHKTAGYILGVDVSEERPRIVI